MGAFASWGQVGRRSGMGRLARLAATATSLAVVAGMVAVLPATAASAATSSATAATSGPPVQPIPQTNGNRVEHPSHATDRGKVPTAAKPKVADIAGYLLKNATGVAGAAGELSEALGRFIDVSGGDAGLLACLAGL